MNGKVVCISCAHNAHVKYLVGRENEIKSARCKETLRDAKAVQKRPENIEGAHESCAIDCICVYRDACQYYVNDRNGPVETGLQRKRTYTSM